MPENRKQLISKLKSLNPTEGKWRTYPTESYIRVITDEPRNIDDRILITLAPSMREELIKMEEEMDKLKQQLITIERLRIEDAGSALDEINHWRDRALHAEEIIKQLTTQHP